jgi:hypothetical protein
LDDEKRNDTTSASSSDKNQKRKTGEAKGKEKK